MPKYTSKKNKSGRTLHDKVKLWDVFETEVGDKSKGTSSLECIYRECGDRECCDQCSFSLAFSEEGFLTCTNTKCGIIYKDTTDQTAEWRYKSATSPDRTLGTKIENGRRTNKSKKTHKRDGDWW